MILAVDQGNSIGWLDGRLPWKLPDDMKRFKALTTGQELVMGRKTFESLNRPDGLPNRQNNVLSKTLTGQGQNLRFWPLDLGSFIANYQQTAKNDLWIIGGATLYDEALKKNLVDEIYLTKVFTDSLADVKLSVNMWNYEDFILSQAGIKNKWMSTDQETMQSNDIKISFIKLTKNAT